MTKETSRLLKQASHILVNYKVNGQEFRERFTGDVTLVR